MAQLPHHLKEKGPASKQFWSAVQACMNAGSNQADAVRQTVEAEPDLHQRMLEENRTPHPSR